PEFLPPKEAPPVHGDAPRQPLPMGGATPSAAGKMSDDPTRLANRFEPVDQSQLAQQNAPVDPQTGQPNYAAGPKSPALQGPPAPFFTEYSFSQLMDMMKQKALWEKMEAMKEEAATLQPDPNIFKQVQEGGLKPKGKPMEEYPPDVVDKYKAFKKDKAAAKSKK